MGAYDILDLGSAGGWVERGSIEIGATHDGIRDEAASGAPSRRHRDVMLNVLSRGRCGR